MKRFILLLSFILAITSACSPQVRSPSVETTSGYCSPNMAHNSGTVTINCKGLDPAIASEISDVVKELSLLNQKTASEKNQQLLIKMLKEMKASLQAAIARPGVQVNGPVTQSSTGNCSPNIVGNNNTNVCGPQDLNIDSQQAADLTNQLHDLIATSPTGKVEVDIEFQNHRTQMAGRTLGDALRRAGLEVKVDESWMLSSSENNYGGITFMNVSPSTEALAMTVAGLLNRLKIVTGPIPTFHAPPGQPATDTLVIFVRRPQD